MKWLWVGLALFGVGFSVWLVMDTDERTDLDPRDAGFTLDARGGTLHVQYVVGAPLATDRVLLHVEHDGQTSEFTGSALKQGTAWESGGSICIVGPGCLLEHAQHATVIVGYDGAALFRGSRDLA